MRGNPCCSATCRADGSLDFGLCLANKLEDGMRSCMREAAILGPGTGRWPGLNAWYLPLGNREQMQGAACIENIEAADTIGREHAQALCALLAQALQRIKMAGAMLDSQAEAARQQVQSTFLAAVSHDLRTPLAALVGAASALQTQGERLGAAERSRLLASIASEAAYLSTLTENTLQLVQLTNAAQPLRKSWESMEEIVGAVLGRMRLREGSQRISARVPVDLPLIEADPVLLAQLLSNLLDNAMQYSPGPIELQVQTGEEQMQVRVKDRGTSLDPALQARLFEPYARVDHSGQRGAGLGLALCRAIAGAHGGSLSLTARQGGGNCFTLCLPLSPQQPQPGEAP
jgi:two-component system sensor histidine kinase KdpD